MIQSNQSLWAYPLGQSKVKHSAIAGFLYDFIDKVGNLAWASLHVACYQRGVSFAAESAEWYPNDAHAS